MDHNFESSKPDTFFFDNSFIRDLPGDPSDKNTSRQVNGACFSLVSPTPAASPSLVAYSREVADLLDFNDDFCTSKQFTNIFAGNNLLPEMRPFAMCYGGHQFGNWAGQLGDGRAINLGELISSKGQRWVLQLKGAGPTPYSRRADGYAVLRSSIREFLCSEAMFHLGVPTTRALSLINTGEQVMRDFFYDGHPKDEPGSVVCRVSPSFIRFGNFEIFAARNEIDVLKQLMDYTIHTDFPHLGKPSKDVYLQWFAEICRTTAELLVHWMRVGFVHGVMNTDNMSILGLTIDYGPYGWLEDYNPQWTPNTTDSSGRRYAFGNQPSIALWNLAQLANAIYPVVNDAKVLEQCLETNYRSHFLSGWRTMQANKLGLVSFEDGDENLITELLDLLAVTETDMTIFYRQLAKLDPTRQPEDRSALPKPLLAAYYRPEEITKNYLGTMYDWLTRYYRRLQQQPHTLTGREQLMNSTNPKYTLRNYLAQLAIEKAEEGDYSMVHELLELVRKPYDDQPQFEKYFAKRPDWARNKPGSSMLS